MAGGGEAWLPCCGQSSELFTTERGNVRNPRGRLEPSRCCAPRSGYPCVTTAGPHSCSPKPIGDRGAPRLRRAGSRVVAGDLSAVDEATADRPRRQIAEATAGLLSYARRRKRFARERRLRDLLAAGTGREGATLRRVGRAAPTVGMRKASRSRSARLRDAVLAGGARARAAGDRAGVIHCVLACIVSSILESSVRR